MGRGYTQYSFPDSDTEDAWALYSAFLDYEFVDGTLLHLQQTECWCPNCFCILMAENIPTMTALETELEILEHPSEVEQMKIDFIGIPLPERISEQRRRIEWRRTRQSPAKCLQCGSTDVVRLPDAKEFPHPVTGERVVRVGGGFASTGEWEARFNPEGDLIRHVVGRA